MNEPKKITEADCAYLAALMDQCAQVKVQIQNRRSTKYQTLLLKFRGLGSETVAWLVATFGPAISFERSGGSEITFVTRRAAELCVHAYPYLLEMKGVARLVTRFAQSLGQNKSPITPERLAIRAEVTKELEALERARGGRR